jgi:hypothetical protein
MDRNDGGSQGYEEKGLVMLPQRWAVERRFGAVPALCVGLRASQLDHGRLVLAYFASTDVRQSRYRRQSITGSC